MILDYAPGTTIKIENRPYTVEEHAALHDVDLRLDILRLVGPTEAHTRWLVAAEPEPYLMLMQRLEHDWLASPLTTVVHDGEIFVNLYRGSANRIRRTRNSRTKDLRVDYALFRADSGRVILTVGQNDEIDAWIGVTLPLTAIQLPKPS